MIKECATAQGIQKQARDVGEPWTEYATHVVNCFEAANSSNLDSLVYT